MPSARKTPVLMRVVSPTPSAIRPGEHLSNPQHALALDEPVAKPRISTATVTTRLWFCAYLPNLLLEASGPAAAARVVVEAQQGIHRVLLACPKAEAAGIMPGQPSSAALALLPTFSIGARTRVPYPQARETAATRPAQ